MLSPLHPQRSVHIDRQLHLEPVVKGCDIKAFHPGLIICHLHIDTVLILAGIDPVDLPAAELQLISAGDKVSFLQLLCQRPDRTPDQPLDPADHIFVPRRTEQNRITVIKDAFLHALLDQFIPFFLRHLCPCQILPVCLTGKPLKRLVGDISQIKRLKAVFLPLGQAQSVVQEMGIRTGRELFQPGNTDPFRIRIETFRRSRADLLFSVCQKSRPQDLFHLPGALCIAGKPGIEFLPLLIQSASALAQSLRDPADPGCSCQFPL